ncbi:MAG: PASTA domain-containing protein [Solirubrobacteraceae bacterium]
MRKAVAIAVVASALALAPEAASGAASISVVQSPPNSVPFGQDVTVTMTVTNTGPDAFEPGTALSLFLLRYESDVMAPSTYTAASGADGRPCTPMATKPPSTDCDLSGFPAGASATYTAVLNARVSVDQLIAVVSCRVDCATLATGDVPTIVGCGVPAVVGQRVAEARRALKAQNCRLGRVTRRSASARKRGRVVAQKPPAGTQLPPEAKVAVVLGGR